MQVVGARLRHNVDGGPARSSHVRAIIAAVDLEFLHRVLAQRQAHAPFIVVGLPSIHRHAVAPAVAAVEGKSAAAELLDPIVRIIRQPGGVGNSGRQQGEAQVVPPVNRQIVDIDLGQCVRLARLFCVHRRRLGRHFDRLLGRRHFQLEIQHRRLSHGDHQTLLDFAAKTLQLHADGIRARRQSRQQIPATAIGNRAAPYALLGVLRDHIRLRQNTARGVGDGPFYARTCALSVCRTQQSQQY